MTSENNQYNDTDYHSMPIIPLIPPMNQQAIQRCRHPATRIANPIPENLLPMSKKGCNSSWAKPNYRYCRLFDTSVTVTTTDNQEAIFKWMTIGQGLQDDLRNLGMSKAMTEVLRLSNDFKLRLRGQEVKSLNDILSIISQPMWYHNNLSRNRGIIYMLAYGIFRNGYNLWALNAAEDWLQTHHLVYMADDDTTQDQGSEGLDDIHTKARSKKGFVYRLLVQSASDIIPKKFRVTMRCAYQEYVSVKNRPLKDGRLRKEDICSYTPLKFRGNDYYLVALTTDVRRQQMQHFEAVAKKAQVQHYQAQDLINTIYRVYGIENTNDYGRVELQGKII